MSEDPRKSKGKAILQRLTGFASDRAGFEHQWEEIARLVVPRKTARPTPLEQPDAARDIALYDSTAVQDSLTLANGQMSHLTPIAERWAVYQAPERFRKSQSVNLWYQQCTEIAFAELGLRSNFYTEIHELYLDRGAFGTGCILVEKGVNSLLQFRHFTCGRYYVAENSEGIVDTVYLELQYTLRQAVQKFGSDQLSEVLRKKYDTAEASPGNLDEKHWFVHAVQPREDYRPGRPGNLNMPIASFYIERDSGWLVDEGGYEEMPYLVTRFLTFGESPWGYGAAWSCMADTRQVNRLERALDGLAEVAVNPRVLIPAGMKGMVDMAAGGVTYFDPFNTNAIPREWMTGGRYDIGFQRAQEKRENIHRAFHKDLFQMWPSIEKQMTAREVAERAAEKIYQFSPTFTKLTTELFNPLLQRVFRILFEAGAFPEPPQELLIEDARGAFLPPPEVQYLSKMALALQASKVLGFVQTVELLQGIAQVDPTIYRKVFHFGRTANGLAEANAVPTPWLNTPEEAAEVEAAEAAALQQQQQAALMQSAAGAAASLSKVNPEVVNKLAA